MSPEHSSVEMSHLIARYVAPIGQPVDSYASGVHRYVPRCSIENLVVSGERRCDGVMIWTWTCDVLDPWGEVIAHVSTDDHYFHPSLTWL